MKIAILVVLYNCLASDSDTIKSLMEYLDENSVTNEYKILVFDNSSKEQIITDNRIKYYANMQNLYLAENYNKALEICKANDIPWLVLLDQDTGLSADYLNVLFSGSLDLDYACYVPRIVGKDNNVLAPYSVGIGFRKKYKIKATDPIYSINSGTIINTKYFFENIKLFSTEYPLDFLDHWYFKKFNEFGGKIKILPSTLIHDLSVAKNKEIVSFERYKMILDAERKFVNTEFGCIDLLLYKFNLLRRYLRFKRVKEKKYADLVMQYFWGKHFE